MYEVLALFELSIWLGLSAWIANATPVRGGGGRPIDGGKLFRDGRRILGDHKTMKGLRGPLYIGIPISFIIFLIFIILWQPIEEIIIQASTEGLYILYNDKVNIFQYYLEFAPVEQNLICTFQIAVLYSPWLYPLIACTIQLSIFETTL